ncbi:MAG: restriction modification system specificity domain protein [Gemmatimonadetes bacterium]|nr:restriction modification system specificity domain protein [Gemmatimonadota bacterium]
MDQQRAIAAVLGALDDKIEQNRRTGRALEKLARATFKAWFVDFEPVKAKAAGATDFPGMPHAAFAALSDRLTDTPLGAVPGGWRISSIGAELETFLGGTPSRARSEFWTDGTVPWINSGEVNKFPIINPTSLITPAALASSSTKLIPARSTVIAITGATLGQVSILGIAACTNQSVVSIIGSKALPTEFIYPWVKENIDRLLATSTGAAQQHVNKKDVNALPVLCPDARLMDGYVSIVGPVFDSVLHLSAESRKLAALRDYLLPRLLSGRVRVLQAETEVKA